MPSPHPQSPSAHVDVLQMREAYEEVDGAFTFTGTLVVYRSGGDLHHAFSKARRYSSPSDVKVEDLSNHILIPASAYSPLFPSGFTRAPDPLPQNCHIKKPSLMSYNRVCQGSQPNRIAEAVLQEAAVCELLKQHPHPNIATYLGCQVSPDGRITGLCFVEYKCTLMKEVNPGAHMKRKLRSEFQRRRSKDYSGVMAAAESDIEHLHAYEWYDEKVKTALPQNDFDALEEIRIWLGDDSKPFQFD
ncbi:hypothetical protein B0T17DRAFT_534474, partial [Bombardia bombarda]